MKTKLLAFFSIIGCASALFGHSGVSVLHTKEEILAQAKYAKNSYVAQERIDYSWGEIDKEEKMEETVINDILVWEVTFRNNKVTDPEKTLIHFFFKHTGEFVGVSFKEIPAQK